jgi:hypothetical protein
MMALAIHYFGSIESRENLGPKRFKKIEKFFAVVSAGSRGEISGAKISKNAQSKAAARSR